MEIVTIRWRERLPEPRNGSMVLSCSNRGLDIGGFYAGRHRRSGTVKCEQKVCACSCPRLCEYLTPCEHMLLAENVQRRSRVGSDELYAA
jgi:hypothetical protein